MADNVKKMKHVRLVEKSGRSIKKIKKSSRNHSIVLLSMVEPIF